MSAPVTDTGLALAVVDFAGIYIEELGQVRVWAAPTVDTAGPETYLELLEGLPGRQGLAGAYRGGKDTDRRGPREF